MTDLLPGFTTTRLSGAGTEIFGRVGGRGPPLLLVHGYPQTHVAWAQVALELARSFTVVLFDLRGYGDSGAPAVDERASAYSKRAMAADLCAGMRELGFARFRLAGHDRGARAAYRLALDSPECVERLAVLSILPTFSMWRKLQDNEYAMRAFRWFFLAQPPPLPQQLVSAAGEAYLHETLAAWTKDKDLRAFPSASLRAYEAAFRRPGAVAAMCADYRAGWTVDRVDDLQDLRDGKVIECPLLVLWGRGEFENEAEMVQAWHEIAGNVTATALDCGHFVAEEAPRETARALMEFFSQ